MTPSERIEFIKAQPLTEEKVAELAKSFSSTPASIMSKARKMGLAVGKDALIQKIATKLRISGDLSSLSKVNTTTLKLIIGE
jgi:hypothetical protein